MDAVRFLEVAVNDLHRGFRGETEGLTQEQFLFRPSRAANSIAFLLWHFARSEDGLVHRELAKGPTLWEQEEWYRRFGLQPDETGSGFDGDRVGAFQPDKSLIVEYSNRVWDGTPPLLASLTAADLDRAPNPDRPTMTLGRTLANLLLGHGFWHLGDIRFLKGLQGMPFSR